MDKAPMSARVAVDGIVEPLQPPKPGDDLLARTREDWDPLAPSGAPQMDDIYYGTMVQNRTGSDMPSMEPNWKPVKNRVLLATALMPMINWQAYLHHLNFVYKCGRRNTDYEFILAGIPRLEIDRARNYLVSGALQSHCEFLYFWDTDTHMAPDTMSRLLEVMRLDDNIVAVSPMYHIRGYPFELMAFKDSPFESKMMSVKEAKKSADKNGLVDVMAVGCGTTLTRGSAYALWSGPWYKTSPTHTEDAWFCMLVKKANPSARFVIDTTIEAGHEIIDPPVVRTSNVEEMRRMFNPTKGWFRKIVE